MKKGEKIDGQFVPITRDVLASPAWQAMGLHARRLIDFLMLEWVIHRGQRNGFLLAPRRQLEKLMRTHAVTDAINEVQRLGFVDLKPGVGRRPTLYRLTWLSHADGSPPTNRWKRCADDAATITIIRKQAKIRPTSITHELIH